MGMHSLLVLFFLVPAILAQSIIVFDHAAQDRCIASGCVFSDDSIWIGGKTPGAQDTAIIQGNITGLVIGTNASVPINIQALILDTATLQLSVNQSFHSNSITLNNTATFKAAAGSQTSGSGVFWLPVPATLWLLDFSTFAWTGNATLLGSIQTEAAATLQINYVVVYSPLQADLAGPVSFGTLNVPSGQNASFANGFEGAINADKSTILIRTSFIGTINVNLNSNVVFVNAMVGILSATGLGNIDVYTSTVFWYPITKSNFNGTVTIDGSGFDAQNLTLSSFVVANSTGMQSGVRGDGLTFSGVFELFGGLTAYGSGGINIYGTVIASDDVSHISLDNSQLTVNGNLVLSNTSAFAVNNSVITLAGLLHASVTLTPGSALTVTAASSIVGYLHNLGGVVNVNTQYPLTLRGTAGAYTQTSGLLNAQLHQEGIAALQVLNGSITLSGTAALQYSITDKPLLTAATFTVATANTVLTGIFNGDAQNLPGSDITRPLSISYDTVAKSIIIKYKLDIRDVEPWMWAVLAVGVALIIVVVVAVIVKCRKRHHYQVVH